MGFGLGVFAQPLCAADLSPVKFRIPTDPATLDWTLARSSSETYIILNLMEGLVRHDENLKIAPALAASWSTSEDGKRYTFKLRPGVKWSDGRVLKAQDFVDSWLRLADSKVHSDYSHFLDGIAGMEKFHSHGTRADVDLRASDDLTLEMGLKNPIPYFLHLLTFWVTFPERADLIAKFGKTWTEASHLAVLGPYRLTSWKKGSKIELSRNPLYYDSVHGPERVEVQIEPNEKKARDSFRAGETDLLLNATTEDLIQSPGLANQFPYLATYYLGFNHRNPILKDLSVRRAIAYAIKREEIPAALQGGQVPAKGFIPPGLDGAAATARESGSLYDARGALSKSAHPEGAGIPKLSLLLTASEGGIRLGDLIRTQLQKNLGIEVENRVLESGTQFQSALKAGKFDLFVSHWGADFPDAINFLEVFESGSGLNLTGWTSPEFDQALKQNRTTLQPEARRKTAELAEKILLDDQAAIVPLYHRKNAVLVGPRISSLKITPLNYFFWRDLVLKGN